jgi:ParB/RepB/Spo0J family partition protein
MTKVKTPPAPQENGHAFTAPELRFIQLSDIAPDPNQPRKYFHEVDDQDLLESIKAQGILQPVLLRPVESSQASAKVKAKSLLVCGERRFRAAQAILESDPSAPKMVPAIIRNLHDEAALEAQIVENLQRKDVHPMEEALAFEMLIKKGLTQEQVGARVGKGDRFVRARLVLCSLTKAWQDLFLRHAIDLETALKLCRFPAVLQDQILKDQKLKKEDLEKKDLRIAVRDFTRYRGDLAAACFDKADPKLNPKMGPCIGCPFNSATANLFPDDTSRPRCTNLACYQIKVDKTFDTLLAQTKDDPSMILVKVGYRALDSAITKEMKAQGLKVYDYTQYRAPGWRTDPGTWEEYSQRMAEDMELADRGAYESELREWEKHKKSLDKGLADGKYKRALVVDGDDEHARGTVITVELTDRQTSGKTSSGEKRLTPAQKVAAGKATLTDLSDEIDRLTKDIKDTEKRIADNAHLAMVKAYKESPVVYQETKTALSPLERTCLVAYLLERLGGVDELVFWATDQDADDEEDKTSKFAQTLGVPVTAGKKNKRERFYYRGSGQLTLDNEDLKVRQKTWDFIAGLDDKKLALIFRRLMVQEYGGATTLPGNYKNGEAFILHQMIAAWDPQVVASCEAEAKEQGDKRIKRAKDRIADLRKKKKEIEDKKASKATAKPAPKKGAPTKAETKALAAVATKGKK